MTLLQVHKGDRGELAKLHRDMDDLIGSFFGDWPAFSHRTVWPAIDIADNENEIVVKAEVPGCKAEDIDISVHGNTLAISGEKKKVHKIDPAICIKCGKCFETCNFKAIIKD